MEEIRKQVQTILKNSQKDIILGVFRCAILNHNEYSRNQSKYDNCNCEYCLANKEYVEFKIQEHNYMKFQMEMFPDVDKLFFPEYLEFKDRMIEKLKNKRDTIKQNIC